MKKKLHTNALRIGLNRASSTYHSKKFDQFLIQRILFSSILLCLALFSFSQSQVAKSIPNANSPEGIIGFLEFKPQNYGSQLHPLIIFLHGWGEVGNGTSELYKVAYNGIPQLCASGASMKFTLDGQEHSFVVLSPQLSEVTRNNLGYWPTYYVKEMIKYATANLNIDSNRIYVTGLSLGGGGVWHLITEIVNGDNSFDVEIAAAAPICGTNIQSDHDNFCNTVGANKLPVWAFHSVDDDNPGTPVQLTRDYQGTASACIPAMSPASKFTYYMTGYHSGAWINAYKTTRAEPGNPAVESGSSTTIDESLYEWFLKQKRNTTPPTSIGCTTNSSPADASTITTSTTATLTWNAATGATSYDVYMWAGATASTTPKATVTTNTYDATGLSPATTYSWYVVPKNTTGSAIGCDANKTTFTTAANQLPVAIITPASTTITLPTNSVTLDGSASYNPAGGDITQYYWSLVSGPSSPTLSDKFLSSITVSNLDAGTYVFQLQVKNAAGIPNYATSTITVNETNQPPLFANPGPDDIVILPTSSYELDGSNSTPAIGIDQYYWSQKSGPNLVSWGDDNSQIGKKKVVSNLIKGEYTFELQVKKGSAVTWSYPLVKITAVERPVVNAGPDDVITLPTNTYTLNGTATTTQGTITEYYWSEDANNPSQVLNVSGHYDAQKVISNLVPGVYTFTLQAKNSYQVPNWRSVKITVKPAGSLRTSSTETKNPDPAVPTKGKLSLYPNPVRNTAVIELISGDDRAKTINLYNSTGVLKAKYTWQTNKGKNIFPLKNIPGLAAGLYVVDVRDANGKSVGNLRFIKL